MTTTPIVLLAPSPGMTFVAMPSGATYVADQNGLVTVASGTVADQLALIAAGCATLEPNAGGVVTTQTGTAYTIAPGDENNAIVFSSASPVTVTLPATAPAGFAVSLYQGGAGQVMAVAAGGASIATPNAATTQAQYSFLSCLVIANTTGANAQWNAVAQPTSSGGGTIGASTLAGLYTQDTTAHYAQYTIAQIFNDTTPANNGTWLKTGTGNGAGNWAQQATATLASLNTLIGNNATALAALQGPVAAMQGPIPVSIWPDVKTYSWGVFDSLGNPFFALLVGGGSVGSLNAPQFALRPFYIWPDVAPNFGGDVAILDAFGVELTPISTAAISAIATSAANAAIALAALTNSKITYVWPDVAAGYGGDVLILDSVGVELAPISNAAITAIATTATNTTIAANGLTKRIYLWPDASATFLGDIAILDANGFYLNYQGQSPYSGYAAYTDTSSYVCAVSVPGLTSCIDIPIAAARGASAFTPGPAIRGLGQPDVSGLLKWMDDGTSDGMAGGTYFTPAHESRLFNFNGAAAVAALSGITKIVLQLMIGQSLSNGTTAAAFTTTNIFSRAFTFNGGPMPYQEYTTSYGSPGALCQDSQLQYLTPLVEIEKPGNINGETYGGGISYWLGQSTNLESTSALVYATLGQGGSSYSANFMQQYAGTASNTMFASVIRCVERIAAWCKLNGWALEIPCIIHGQGENDYGYSAGSYYSALVANQAAYNTAIAAVFTKWGLSNNGPGGAITQIPFLCIQPSSWAFYSDTTAPAMYEYVQLVTGNSGKFYIICPQYWNANYNTGSGQHMTGLGYRQCAEYAGRAIQRLRAGSTSDAVYATAVSNSGLTLTITFSNLTLLVHDTSVVSDPNSQWGIRLLNGSGANVALSSFSIVGTNQVECTMAGSISGQNCTLGIADYAYGTLGLTSGPTTSARAPLRDSATDTMSSAAGGLTMYNYACAQQLGFTGV